MNNIFEATATTPPRIIGATIYALNRTYSLAPTRAHGEPETVIKVLNAHTGLVKTNIGNVYTNGEFGILRFNEQQPHEPSPPA